MAKKLRNLTIKRVSLVDEPCNEPSRIVIYKGGHMESSGTKPARPDWAEDEDEDDDLEHMREMKPHEREAYRKTKKKCKGEGMEIEKKLEVLKSEVEALEKRKAELETEIKTKLAENATTDEELVKSISDPSVRAVVLKAKADAAKANETLAKMADATETREHVEKAKAFDLLPVKAEEFGPVLKRLHKGSATDADFEELERVLKAANETMRKSGAFEENGRPGHNGSDDTKVLISKSVDKIMKEDKLSYGDALAKLFRDEPTLYDAYLERVSGVIPVGQRSAGMED